MSWDPPVFNGSLAIYCYKIEVSHSGGRELVVYHIVGIFGNGKVWQIWRVVCDLLNPIFTYSVLPLWMRLSICQIFLPTNFDSAIHHQTFTLPNIFAIWGVKTIRY